MGEHRRTRTLSLAAGIRLQAISVEGGGTWYAVTRDELVNLGLFTSATAAVACFEAARRVVLRRRGRLTSLPAAAGAESASAHRPRPAKVLFLDDFRPCRRG